MKKATSKPNWQLQILGSISTMASCILRYLVKSTRCVTPRLSYKVKSRWQILEDLETLREKRETKKFCLLFFCSSAGEYEQALPIMEKAEANLDCFIIIIFVSQSGLDFAKARNENRYFALSPFDNRAHWQKIFTTLNPNSTIVIRHELWPAFLEVASCHGKLILANTSIHCKARKQWIYRPSNKFYLTLSIIYFLCLKMMSPEIINCLF